MNVRWTSLQHNQQKYIFKLCLPLFEVLSAPSCHLKRQQFAIVTVNCVGQAHIMRGKFSLSGVIKPFKFIQQADRRYFYLQPTLPWTTTIVCKLLALFKQMLHKKISNETSKIKWNTIKTLKKTQEKTVEYEARQGVVCRLKLKGKTLCNNCHRVATWNFRMLHRCAPAGAATATATQTITIIREEAAKKWKQ